jgi:hypothetical protein
MLYHGAGIAWQKKSHVKNFKDQGNYRKFYKILVRVTRSWSLALSIVLQRKLVGWLHRHGESRAADWYEKYCVGDRGN